MNRNKMVLRKGMKKCCLLMAMMLCVELSAQTQNPSYIKYIEKYKKAALEQEKAHKIPACITLAQGLLESGAGESELAKQANNHFGIKCHSDWQGDTYTHDDETKNECFRSYKKASESYEDHSRFLLRPRYASLFELDITDYKGWAHGLKRCGYATDPGYAAKLIKIIEDYDLAKISGSAPAEEVAEEPTKAEVPVVEKEQSEPTLFTPEQTKKEKRAAERRAKEEKAVAEKKAKEEKAAAEKKAKEEKAAAEKKAKEEKAKSEPTATKEKHADQKKVEAEKPEAEDVVSKAMTGEKKAKATMGVVDLFPEHTVYSDKFVKWVVAEKGDTYELIAEEFNIENVRILRYNNAKKGDKPKEGDRVYITNHK